LADTPQLGTDLFEVITPTARPARKNNSNVRLSSAENRTLGCDARRQQILA